MKELFTIRGFNPCESLLRHTPEQLRSFIRRMKQLNFNSIIIHYDYGWKRYRELILEECAKAGVEITLMTFGPRTFYRFADWKKDFLARKEDGSFFTEKLECETFPCRFAPGALDAFEAGAKAWLREVPPQIRHVHMRAADGGDFCECPRCRQLERQDRWNPFVERFIKAVRETRPDLKAETDVYYLRYDFPQDTAAFAAMDRIMFDTFPRTPTHPLGSAADTSSRGLMRDVYGSSHDSPEVTLNTAMLDKIKMWNRAFPGKVYIHENVMKQGFAGNFQYGTRSYLEDLQTLHDLGIQGIMFEAFEPGYGAYADLFPLLARAMNGEKVNYTPCELDRIVRELNCGWFCDRPDFPLDRYFSDPVMLKNQLFYQKRVTGLSLQYFRDYVQFALEHSDRLDPLYIGHHQARMHLVYHKIKFRDLSPEAEKLLNSRKLWDFMEDIPESQDPRQVCRGLIEEFLRKAEPTT